MRSPTCAGALGPRTFLRANPLREAPASGAPPRRRAATRAATSPSPGCAGRARSGSSRGRRPPRTRRRRSTARAALRGASRRTTPAPLSLPWACSRSADPRVARGAVRPVRLADLVDRIEQQELLQIRVLPELGLDEPRPRRAVEDRRTLRPGFAVAADQLLVLQLMAEPWDRAFDFGVRRVMT